MNLTIDSLSTNNMSGTNTLEGIAHLLGESLTHQDIVWVEPQYIKPNVRQPRRTFHSLNLHELSISIKEHGVLQPILVRSIEDYYEIIAGERRWRAAQMVHLDRIPCRILNLSDGQTLEVALLENVQRQDLNPIEEARAYQQLMNTFHYTQDHIAQRISKSRSHIANLLRLLQLPESIQQELEDGTITFGHARALLASKQPHEDAQIIKERSLSVRATEEHIRNHQRQQYQKNPKIESRPAPSPQHAEGIAELEYRITTAIKRDVKVKFPADFGKGSLEIFFQNPTELSEFLREFVHI